MPSSVDSPGFHRLADSVLVTSHASQPHPGGVPPSVDMTHNRLRHHRASHLVPLAAALGSLAVPASAQLTPNGGRGPFSTLSAGISLEPHPWRQDERPYVAQPARSGPALPVAGPYLLNSPDYSRAKIRAGMGLQQFTVEAEIDALSLGSDLLPDFNTNGTPVLNNSVPSRRRWMSIVVSVDNGAVGLDDSFVEERRLLGSGSHTKPGTDLISYFPENNQGLDPSVVGESFLEKAFEDFGLPSTPTGPQPEIDALDFAMGVHVSGQQTVQPVVLPDSDYLFFSLTSASASTINDPLNDEFAVNGPGPGTMVPADGVTIYRMEWLGSSWGPPHVYLDHEDLALHATDDIDALSVDKVHGRVIYSTQPYPGRSQLRVHAPRPGDDPINETLREGTATHSGANMTTKLGLRDGPTAPEKDDIDAVCVIDPEGGVVDPYFGTPVDRPNLAPSNPTGGLMGLSMTRARFPFDEIDTIFLEATGWGGRTPQPCNIEFFVSLDYDQSLPWTSSTWLSIQAPILRSAQDDSVVIEIDVPAGAVAGSVGFFALCTDTGSEFAIESAILRTSL